MGSQFSECKIKSFQYSGGRGATSPYKGFAEI